MPKGPTRKNKDRPLRRLRNQLGITQADLSKLTGIPIDTIRSLDNGRIVSMTHDVLRKIGMAIGAAWDEESRTWVIGTLVSKTSKPITREFCEQYRQMLNSEPADDLKEMDVYAIKLRIEKLFNSVPKRSWVKLAFRFNDYLEQLRQDFAPDDRLLAGEFGRSQMRLGFFVEAEAKKLLCVNRGYPGEIRAIGRGQRPPSNLDFKPTRWPSKQKVKARPQH